LGAALAGSDRPLLVTSGTGIANAAPGRPAIEEDAPESAQAIPRAASEQAAASIAAKGVRIGVMRLPQVHDTVKQGLVSYVIELARKKGVSAYVGDGRNRWRRCMSSMRPEPLGSRLKNLRKVLDITPWPKRAC
jgi:hypothetical protein